jgi:hypothetical protein
MRARNVRLLAAVVVAVGVGGVLASPAMAKPQDHKIAICHVPPGNPDNAHVITIDQHAWVNGHTPHNSHDADFVVDDDNQCSAGGGTITTTTTTTTVPDGGPS